MKNNTPANFKLRLLAYLIDNVIGLLVFVLCLYYVSIQPNLASALSSLLLATMLIFLNPVIYLHPVLLTHFFGGTGGKLLTGLRVIDEKGSKLSFKRILFRQYIGYSFSWLVFGLGYLSVARDPQKQAWHDKTVGSKVVIKQNLWPLAVVICLVTIIATTYLTINSYKTITTGPLALESKQLWNQIEASSKDDKPKTKNSLTPSHSIPTNSVGQ